MADAAVIKTQSVDIYNSLPVPERLIREEVEDSYVSDVITEMREILDLYKSYNDGVDFASEGTQGNYVASDHRSKLCKSIIDKEARFFLSKTPEITVTPNGETEQDKKTASTEQDLIDAVLKDNKFGAKLVRAAKDCFIGKRVLAILNFNASGVALSFVPSTNFMFETDDTNVDVLQKVVAFIVTRNSANSNARRIYKKKYEMRNGFCYVEEGIYDGAGNLIKGILGSTKTRFTYIPAVIISNDGLSGNIMGESEIAQLIQGEQWYNKLNGADIDAERKGMNSIIWALDMNPETTNGLSTSPGSFWDLHSDDNGAEGRTGSLGMLEPGMTYSGALAVTLDRTKKNMYALVDMPDADNLEMKVTSGKALKAVYWGLIVRCDEKFMTWGPAIEFLAHTILEGVKLYPESAKPHREDYSPTGEEYEISVVNQYPILSDETEEKTVDLGQVQNQVMSKKAYIKKWLLLNDQEADAELKQIAAEKDMLEMNMMPDLGNPPEGQEGEDSEGGESPFGGKEGTGTQTTQENPENEEE